MAHPLAPLLRSEFALLTSYVPENPPGITVRLDANEAPPCRSPQLRDIVRQAVGRIDLERYPDARALEFKEQIARRTGARPEELLVGSGSDEVIALVLNGLASPRPGAAKPIVLAPTPTFVMYRVTAMAHGFVPVEVPLDAAWDLDVSAMKDALAKHRPNVIFIASPNNPTGNAMAADRVAAVLEAAPTSFVIVDEAYVDYAPESLRRWRSRYPHMGVLRTLSKIGLAALRVGWLEADANLVAELDKGRQPYNVSATSQGAAAAVLRDGWDTVQEEVAGVCRERTRLALELARFEGVDVTPSQANFHWVRTPKPAAEVAQALAQRGILVRSFAKAGGRLTHSLRITVGSPEDNDRLLEGLRACLG